MQKERQEFQSALDRQSNTFEQKLDIVTVKFESELEKRSKAYTQLREERGEVIKNIYQKVVNLEDDIGRLLNRIETEETPDIDEQISETNNAINDLEEYYRKNKIFLTEDTCAEIEYIIDTSQTSYDKFVESYPEDGDFDGESETADELSNLEQRTESEFKKLKRELVDRFRELLGVGEVELGDRGEEDQIEFIDEMAKEGEDGSQNSDE